MNIYSASISRHNLNHEKQNILLMIPSREKCHYLAAKKLPALIRGTTSKHVGDFYFVNYLCSFRTKTNLNLIKMHVKIKMFVVL